MERHSGNVSCLCGLREFLPRSFLCVVPGITGAKLISEVAELTARAPAHVYAHKHTHAETQQSIKTLTGLIRLSCFQSFSSKQFFLYNKDNWKLQFILKKITNVFQKYLVYDEKFISLIFHSTYVLNINLISCNWNLLNQMISCVFLLLLMLFHFSSVFIKLFTYLFIS